MQVNGEGTLGKLPGTIASRLPTNGERNIAFGKMHRKICSASLIAYLRRVKDSMATLGSTMVCVPAVLRRTSI